MRATRSSSVYSSVECGNALATRREAATLLAVLGVGQGAGADAELRGARVYQGAAAGGAVGVAGAPARDELSALAVADIAGTRRVGLEGAGLDGSAASVVVVVVPGIVVIPSVVV